MSTLHLYRSHAEIHRIRTSSHKLGRDTMAPVVPTEGETSSGEVAGEQLEAAKIQAETELSWQGQQSLEETMEKTK